MNWRQIKTLKELTVCPNFFSTNSIKILKKTKTRINAECECGCRMYETKKSMWFCIDFNPEKGLKPVDFANWMNVRKQEKELV